MSLFSRGGNGPSEGRCGPSEGRWSAQGHMQWLFPCPCSPVYYVLFWLNGYHTHMCGAEENWNIHKKTDYISLENNQKWSKNLKSTMYILKVDDTSCMSRYFPGAEPERGHMHDMGSLSPAYNALLIFPIKMHKPGSPFCVFFFDAELCILHTELSLLWSLSLHPIL